MPSRNHSAIPRLYIPYMLGFLRSESEENHASSLGKVIVTLVLMSALFGFGLATLIFRLQTHSSPTGVIPALVLSFIGLCAQFGMVRLLIRHITQTQE